MAARRGASFNELDEDETRLVTIAAAIDACIRARAGASAAGQATVRQQSLWQRAARLEALRVVNFEIEIDGAARTVTVEPDGPGRYRVVVDGEAHEVRAERAGEFGLSLIVGDASNASRELQIAPGAARGELLVALGGRTVPVDRQRAHATSRRGRRGGPCRAAAGRRADARPRRPRAGQRPATTWRRVRAWSSSKR